MRRLVTAIVGLTVALISHAASLDAGPAGTTRSVERAVVGAPSGEAVAASAPEPETVVRGRVSLAEVRPAHLQSRRPLTAAAPILVSRPVDPPVSAASPAANPLDAPATTVPPSTTVPPVAVPPSTAVPPVAVPPSTTVPAAPTTTVAPAVTSDPGAASWFVSAVNDLRAGLGLAILARNGDLDARARSWAEQMAAGGVLGHSSNTHGLVASGWATAGENVGVGGSADAVFSALVASSSHYDNMVNPAFTSVGVGVAVDASGAVWTAHLFAG
ncbi:MAG: CAP domain-containing protein [Acidimicrobiales bacterium]